MKKFTDFPFGEGTCVSDASTHIIVGPRKAATTGGEDGLNNMFNAIVSFYGAEHVGTLCHRVLKTGIVDALEYQACGGELSVKAFSQMPNKIRERPIGDGDGFYLVCNGCCDIITQIMFAEPLVLKNLMLHLMLKQMFPNLHCCNYIDCGAWDSNGSYGGSVTAKEKNEIKNLGTLALSENRLMLGRLSKGIGARYYGLGFRLISGMNTVEDFDGFDNWARFLINQKFFQIKDFLDLSKSFFLGPKTTRK